MPKVYQINYENSLEIEKELFNTSDIKGGIGKLFLCF